MYNRKLFSHIPPLSEKNSLKMLSMNVSWNKLDWFVTVLTELHFLLLFLFCLLLLREYSPSAPCCIDTVVMESCVSAHRVNVCLNTG